MKARQALPENYTEIFAVDLQKDKKIALIINVFGLIIMAALAVPMHFFVPITTLFDMSDGLGAYTVRFVALLLLLVAYMILHELIHGITMKLYGTKKVKYGFTGMYAYAGSEDYYNKKSYLIIALAPVIILGVVIAVINAFVPREWFWVVYVLQIGNISGAVGDLYVTAKFSKFPRDILVKDSGVAMTVYAKQ